MRSTIIYGLPILQVPYFKRKIRKTYTSWNKTLINIKTDEISIFTYNIITNKIMTNKTIKILPN